MSRQYAVHDGHVDHISYLQRVAAAGASSVVSTVVVNPLDVVKARLQAQSAVASPAVSVFRSQHVASSPAADLAVCGCSGSRGGWSGAVGSPHAVGDPSLAARLDAHTRNSVVQLRRIVQQEGVWALWRGSNLGALMQVPLIGIYLPLYDTLHARLPQDSAFSPLAAGVAARTAAVLATSPLEFIKVRLQAAEAGAGATATVTACAAGSASRGWRGASALAGGAAPAAAAGLRGAGPAGRAAPPGAGSSSGSGSRGVVASRTALRRTLSGVVAECAALPGVAQRVAYLWTGVAASLAKDLPFAAIYWSALEPVRHALLPDQPSHEVSCMELAAVNACAAALAASVAATATQPMDVVKTHAQIRPQGPLQQRPPGIWQAVKGIAAASGPRGLFVGLAPRVARSAAAYGIVMASYELAKFQCVPPQ